jgi:alanine racemase
MLRPGLALYGYAPRFAPRGTQADASAAILKPVLPWKTRVISTRIIPQSETVSYNETFRAKRETKLALLDAGYADGLDRRLSNRFALLVRGELAPIAGRVCMDQCMLDVTDIPGVESGDEVVILGEQGTRAIDAYAHADLLLELSPTLDEHTRNAVESYVENFHDANTDSQAVGGWNGTGPISSPSCQAKA